MFGVWVVYCSSSNGGKRSGLRFWGLVGFYHVATGENPGKLDQRFFLTFNRNIDGKEIGTDV